MNFLEKIRLFPDAITGQLFCDPERNGEYKFLKKFLSSYGKLTIFDVGANIGDYSEKILSINPLSIIYCFEPVNSTFSKLKLKLEKYPNVKLNNFALGEIETNKEIFIYCEEAGSNSLYYHESHASLSGNLRKEKISIKKLDTIVQENNISKIDFVKIDVEGNELNVLKGAINSIRAGIINLIQFEYNSFWQKSSATLEEVFDLLKAANFNLYRLTPWGKIPIKKYLNKLENYKQSNYLAILNE